MELRIYSPEMELLGIIDNASSTIWTRRYFEPGETQVVLPITQDNLDLTRRGNLIYKRDSKEAAVIEDREIEEGYNIRKITIKGRFLSSYMDRRLIRPTVTFSGKVELAMRQLLAGSYPIPLVELGELQNLPETTSFQATYKGLLKYETKLAKCAGYGYRFRPDWTARKIYFEVYEGLDHSASQSDRPRVIFSDAYSNLNDTTYRENEQEYKNVLYIGGEGEGSARKIVSIGDSSGLDRREAFVDARDLRQDTDITDAAYEEMLLQRGREKASEMVISECVECETLADINFRYKTDYDLGDIVTVRKANWGIDLNMRITEISEVYEQGQTKIVPTLGDPLKETIDWSDD